VSNFTGKLWWIKTDLEWLPMINPAKILNPKKQVFKPLKESPAFSQTVFNNATA
jgi:hypothetical protein